MTSSTGSTASLLEAQIDFPDVDDEFESIADSINDVISTPQPVATSSPYLQKSANDSMTSSLPTASFDQSWNALKNQV